MNGRGGGGDGREGVRGKLLKKETGGETRKEEEDGKGDRETVVMGDADETTGTKETTTWEDERKIERRITRKSK